MDYGTARGIEATLRLPVEMDLSLNDLRIIVDCIGAVSYMSDIYDEPFLDVDGKKLMERLRGLYRDQLENRGLSGAAPPSSILDSAS